MATKEPLTKEVTKSIVEELYGKLDSRECCLIPNAFHDEVVDAIRSNSQSKGYRADNLYALLTACQYANDVLIKL